MEATRYPLLTCVQLPFQFSASSCFEQAPLAITEGLIILAHLMAPYAGYIGPLPFRCDDG